MAGGFSSGFSSGFSGGYVGTPPIPPTAPPAGGGGVLPGLVSAGDLSARYSIRMINPRTLATIAELDPGALTALTWERRQYEPGPWSMTIPNRLAQALTVIAGDDVIKRQNMIEIWRDGLVEFRGYITARKLDLTGTYWTLEGYSLLEWLYRRYAARFEVDARSGPGETVLKEYIDANLGGLSGGPGAGSRAATLELTGKTFTIEDDAARGADVDYSAQRTQLATLTADVCRQAEILCDIVMNDAGLEFIVTEPEDHTSSTGAVPFAINSDNVEGLGYQESFSSVANALVIAGQESGGVRITAEVVDTESVAEDFRREGVFDDRKSTTTDQLVATGAAEIRRQLQAAIAIEVVPLTAGGRAVYHQDFEVGWDITAAIPAAGVAAIDRRVSSIKVSIDRDNGERVSLTLGQEQPGSVLRRLTRTLAKLHEGAVT